MEDGGNGMTYVAVEPPDLIKSILLRTSRHSHFLMAELCALAVSMWTSTYFPLTEEKLVLLYRLAWFRDTSFTLVPTVPVCW